MRILVFVFLNIFAECDENDDFESKNRPLPFFRRRVEEVIEDSTVYSKSDDPQNKLVSFLFKNVKEIFKDDDTSSFTIKEVFKDNDKSSFTLKTILNDDNKSLFTKVDEHSTTVDETTKIWFNVIHKSTIIFTPNRTTTAELMFEPYAKHTDDIMLFENISLTPMPFLVERKGDKFTVNLDDITKHSKPTNLSKDFLLLGKELIPFLEDAPLSIFNNETENVTETIDVRRSCIFCNNVDVADCTFPKKKFIPSIICQNEDDVCYTLHTPFGIVDRGCYNVNNNMTTYVCTCNLCNYLSISELPYLYTKKREWIDNVIELSRTKRFRTSIFKEMSCLRCEVNTTTNRRFDLVAQSNCLEGNIGLVTTQECKEDEICGVIAVKSAGYLWRGCVKSPLYNNWMTLCDFDLCNYEDIASIYDPE